MTPTRAELEESVYEWRASVLATAALGVLTSEHLERYGAACQALGEYIGREARETAVAMALVHTDELKGAWERGAITEHDGLGGLRSNRNVEVNRVLARALGAPLTTTYLAPAEQEASAP